MEDTVSGDTDVGIREATSVEEFNGSHKAGTFLQTDSTLEVGIASRGFLGLEDPFGAVVVEE